MMVRLKRIAKLKTAFLGVKLTPKEYNAIKRKAKLYADGNVSEYVLYALKHFQVTEKDLV